MYRYAALAKDNIRRDPLGYLNGVFYRAWRLFYIKGTDDRFTAQQFIGSRLIYLGASAASAVYMSLFLAGAFIGWRKGYAVWLPLAIVTYLAVTIAWFLTNMRYSITVQPLMFTCIAVSVVSILERLGLLAPADEKQVKG